MAKLTQGAILRGRVNAYLRRCFRAETPPREKELAVELGMSISQLSRRGREAFGRSLHEVFLQAEVECAKEHLRGSGLVLNRIAYICGFGTRANFFLVFRKRTGMTPGQYRAKFHTSR